MAYIFNEDDFIMEEIPLKKKVGMLNMPSKKKAVVEIEECEPYNPYYHQPIILTLNFPPCAKKAEFVIDSTFIATSVDLGTNTLNNYKVFVNGSLRSGKLLNERVEKGDEIKVVVYRRRYDQEATLVFHGYNPDIVFDESKDNPVFPDEEEQWGIEYVPPIGTEDNGKKIQN